MNFSTIMGGLAGTGQAMFGAQQYQQAQADTQMKQMQALAMKQQVEQQQLTAAEVKASMGELTGGVKSAADQVKFAQALLTRATRDGNLAGVETAQKALDSAEKQQVREENVLVKRLTDQNNRLGDLAMSYEATESPETYAELTAAAEKAGIPRKTIPAFGDPKVAPWVQEVETRSKAGEAHLKAKADAQKVKDDLDFKKEQLNSNEALKAAAEAQKADYQSGLLKLREDTNRILAQGRQMAHEERMARIDAVKASPEKLTSDQRKTSDAIAVMAHEGVRSLKSFGAMPAGTTTGAFVDLTSHDAIGALTKVGGQILTGQAAQYMRTAGAGFARAVLTSETAGTSRMPTDSQIIDMNRAVVPGEGDTYWTGAYKIATGNAIMLNRLETRHTNPDPRVEERLQADEDYMRTLPTPDEIYAASRQDPRSRAQLLQLGKTSSQLMEDVKSGNWGNKTGNVAATPSANALPDDIAAIILRNKGAK